MARTECTAFQATRDESLVLLMNHSDQKEL